MNEKDPLCMKVVEKFTGIYGNVVGNVALSCLPFGGIFLTGGVSNGIKEYLLSTDTFMNHFNDKGRLAGVMQKFKVMLVKPGVEVGLMGS